MAVSQSTAGLFLSALVFTILWVNIARRNRRHQHSHGLANLPSPEAKSWWKGNFDQALNPKAWDFHMRLLKEYAPVVRLDAFLGDKQLIVFDPKAMHHILVKDQAMYDKPKSTFSGGVLIFGKGLVTIQGEAHRKQRRALNPVFSIAHMRNMLPIFYDVVHKVSITLIHELRFPTHDLVSGIRNQLEDGLSSKFKDENAPQEIEILSWMSRTALELVGQAGLGYSFDDLADDSGAHPYTGILKQLVTTLGRMWFIRSYIVNFAVKIGSPSFRRWVLDRLPWKGGHRLRDMSDYMWELSKQIHEGKKRALAGGDEAVARQVGKGKDIMSILMRLNMEEGSQSQLDEDEVLGQMSSLIFAAMDTTSSALARVLHILSTRLDVQGKLRQEILEARKKCGDQDIPYDELVSLPYLDAVCRETLRLYPPVPYVFRVATQDMILPLSNPVTGIDGTSISEIHIPNKTAVTVSIINSNRNPVIWGPDALEWKPERWLSPLPDELIEAHIPGVYSHLMTFNAGSRSCIGFKFSQLEMNDSSIYLPNSTVYRPEK
ncbi:hypothetical protein D9758_013693 [Tetrapyrgos nigripes]|uniref:Cytochrome P450 n=1 Tax=Tetrapyrgos nigripes TaxID=182062 RepID=A0A8H5CLA2_9AGAR|nr:hypothetical protein D9758_013693 [Tetrapyrgos nigripes]